MQASLLVRIAVRQRWRKTLPSLIQCASLCAGFTKFDADRLILRIAGHKLAKIWQGYRIIAFLHRDLGQRAFWRQTLRIDLERALRSLTGGIDLTGAELRFRETF